MMKPSEELMLLLELNNFDVTKFKLKKQLEYERTGNLDLYRHKKFQNLIISHYNYEDDTEYLRRNPLTYKPEWGEEIKSIDQFYVTHPDLDGDVTLKEFLAMKQFNDINREAILYDIFDGWVEEYRESTITQMENLREMVRLMPKKSRKYKKPGKIWFLFALIMMLIVAFLYMSPDSLKIQFFPIFNPMIDAYVQLLYDIPWYSLFGNAAIMLLALFAIGNLFFARYIRDIRSEKNKHAEKTFDKWEQNMKDERLKQAGILEDYVDVVIKNRKKSFLDITTLVSPAKLLNKFKRYVMMVEYKYDFMTKYYKRFRRILRWIFVLAFLTYVAFLGVGFALQRGWI